MNFETLYDGLINGEEKLALIGLGYVGMPLAVEFAKHVKVIGFNHNENESSSTRVVSIRHMRSEMKPLARPR